MSIWVNTLVQNEEKYLWFSIASVVEHVDRILIWDTGSSDNTLGVVKSLQEKWGNKISFKEVGSVNPNEFTSVRSEMLKVTDSDWVLILDGDEVWWERNILEAKNVITSKGDLYDSIVGEYVNLVGDIYHYQDKNAGRYKVKGREGFITMRFMNKERIKGLKIDRPHGQQGFFDGDGRLIQDRSERDMYFLENGSFMHFTNLQRSSSRNEDLKVPKRKFKLKYELGNKFPLDYYYPEAFFKPRPTFIDSPWSVMDNAFYINSFLQTPLRKIKRKIFKGKSGY